MHDSLKLDASTVPAISVRYAEVSTASRSSDAGKPGADVLVAGSGPICLLQTMTESSNYQQPSHNQTFTLSSTRYDSKSLLNFQNSSSAGNIVKTLSWTQVDNGRSNYIDMASNGRLTRGAFRLLPWSNLGAIRHTAHRHKIFTLNFLLGGRYLQYILHALGLQRGSSCIEKVKFVRHKKISDVLR